MRTGNVNEVARKLSLNEQDLPQILTSNRNRKRRQTELGNAAESGSRAPAAVGEQK
jgi:hypothetical protein